ncbi:MAG: NAD-glutamate dehydrogenase [Alphaproteobacteria bacterium]
MTKITSATSKSKKEKNKTSCRPDGVNKFTGIKKDIAELLCQNLAPEDLHSFNDVILKTATESHWNMAKERKLGDPKISVYCPVNAQNVPHKTVIDIVSDDFAFLVDSVVAEINTHNHLIELLLHPIAYTKYDNEGNLERLQTERDEKLIRQSHIHIHINENLTPDMHEALEKGLYETLADVYYANRDWQKMLAALKKATEELANAPIKRPLREIQKFCSFLDYIADNNFTLLGYREYEFTERGGELHSKTVKGKSLGLLSDDFKPAYISEDEEGLPRNLQELRRKLAPVSISKTNRVSTVHRPVPMDAIAIKTYNDDGEVIGEKLFLGLFTSVTYSRSVGSVPYIREKVEDVLEMAGFMPTSHDGKALRHILEKYPRDELFQIEPKELLNISTDILKLQERQRIALFMRKDPFGRYISCLVYIPRDRFGTDLRQEIIRILSEELNGECSNFSVLLDDSVFARLNIVMRVSQKKQPRYKVSDIEARLQEAGQTWAELISSALYQAIDDHEYVTSVSHRYADAFPVSYTSRYRAKQAVFDIEKIENVLATQTMDQDLYRPEGTGSHQLRLKVYNPDNPLTLSDVMPILDNMGVRSISELPFEVKPHGTDQSVWIHDFLLETPDDMESIEVSDVKFNFERAFSRIWYDCMENDHLNRLTLSANLNWHEITILRTYVRYLKQIRFPFSRTYCEKALTQNAHIARMIVDLFKAYHNPELNQNEAKKKVEKIVGQIENALEKVESLDQDRILRAVCELIHATMRTNYFQRDDEGHAKSYLTIKVDCKQVSYIPDPKPFREIYVYSPQVEAVHLRGDKIARGGLRWSDRQEDYRTEVLGLMKAQMVKNAVIVPMGAKGGFVVKTPTNSREEFRSEGIKCYKTFIQALLDITDNLDGETVIKPKNVVCRDEDDPYLVVAADKGTATFSDIANEISLANDFWLGDAFASGGSAGYDHKKMGITARGAWESVKAHFRMLNHNIQESPFDVVGIGDMGGDVFGNGMLLSEHIRLIGAFNHLHIFCDPDPDTAKSFKERKRLFDGVMGWDEYDTKVLSKGGRIYSRNDKVLELTPEIKERFDIQKDKLSPPELMKAMLKSRTDLLWFGGIGTYIKSSKETNADVGDKANDNIRINGLDVRAKVIGEGANLGVTQLGRVEFDEKGGKINTDFLDNSGGVDSSDHEVNIKILFSDIMRKKSSDMDVKKRNKILESMTEEVADLVLRSNYQQAQAISLIEHNAPQLLQAHEEFITELEREDGLSRKIEGLPDKEAVESRLRNSKGLTRPELCILLSYAKIGFTQDLLASDVPDNKNMDEWLINYFPKALREKYQKDIFNHKLRREIVATTMANSLVNRMGPTFLKSSMEKSGVSCEEVAKAYIIVRDVFSLRDLWDHIEALDNKVPAQVQIKAMQEIAFLSQHAIMWFLTRLGRSLDIGKDIQNFKQGITALRDNFDDVINESLRRDIEERERIYKHDGLPAELAYQIALMPVLASACDIIRISVEQKTDILITARAYFDLGERFQMGWLRQQAKFISSDDRWYSEATKGLIDQLYSCQAGLTIRILRDTDTANKKKAAIVDSWMQKHQNVTRQYDSLFADLKRVGTIDLPMLVIAEQRLRNLIRF